MLVYCHTLNKDCLPPHHFRSIIHDYWLSTIAIYTLAILDNAVKRGKSRKSPSPRLLICKTEIHFTSVGHPLLRSQYGASPQIRISQLRGNPNLKYTTRKISASMTYLTVRREGNMGRARGEQDALFAVANLPSPHLGWLATNVCVCDDQQSSEISCGKFQGKVVPGAY
jgi:hypothetical protein